MKGLVMKEINVKQVMHPLFGPTEKQVSYLVKLTGIKNKTRLGRFVASRVGKTSPEIGGPLLTKYDFSKAIDAEVKQRRLVN